VAFLSVLYLGLLVGPFGIEEMKSVSQDSIFNLILQRVQIYCYAYLKLEHAKVMPWRRVVDWIHSSLQPHLVLY